MERIEHAVAHAEFPHETIPLLLAALRARRLVASIVLGWHGEAVRERDAARRVVAAQLEEIKALLTGARSGS